MDERRQHKRSTINTTIIWNDEHYRVVDFSMGGCAIYSPKKLWELDESYEVAFVMGGVSLNVNLVFIYYNESLKRYGARIIYNDERDSYVLEQFVSIKGGLLE